MFLQQVKALILISLASTSLPSSERVNKHIKPCPLQFLKHFNNHADKYVLHFIKTKRLQDYELSPHESVRSRVFTFETKLDMSMGIYRISDTFNVIIYHLRQQHDYVKQLKQITYMNDFVVPSRTIFLFVNQYTGQKTLARSRELSNFSPELQVFAALKLILTLPQQNQCNRNETTVTVICAGYCTPTSWNFTDFEENYLVNSFYSLHRSLFWNGNRKVLPGLVSDTHSFIADTPKQNQGVCLSASNRIDYKCKNGIMTMLTYSQVHNITINFQNAVMTNIIKFGVGTVYKGPEQLSFSIRFFDNSLPPSFINQLAFSTFESQRFVYCPKIKRTDGTFVEFAVWYEPVTQESWTTLMFLLSFAAVCSYIHHRRLTSVLGDLLQYWAAVFGASFKIRYFLVISALSFFLSQIYCDGFTSIITVAHSPEGMKTVRQLINSGFKILFNQEQMGATYEEAYGDTFNRLGLSTDGVFLNVQSIKIADIVFKIATMKDSLIAFQTKMSVADYYVALTAEMLRIQNLTTDTFTCFAVEQTLKEGQDTSILESENNYWLQLTTQRIRAMGLYYKWNEWSQWHHMLKLNILHKKHRGGPDFVDLPKFLAVLLACGTLLSISFAFWCIERSMFQKVGDKIKNVCLEFIQIISRLVNHLKTRLKR
ncbi:unnamed protein product [Orchesella dallaii]|uniref:Ionotropic glutamate receptor C-terminal domain-containing protein n=1 Tax=Orchesella dallaii TaxID=48710 RepID=A0ABP1R2M9_9HEXA